MINRERLTYELNLEEHTLDEFQNKLAAREVEGLILRCTDDRRIDLGAICYDTRDSASRKMPKPVRSVSLRPERCVPIKSWCVEKANGFYLGASAYTIYAHATELVSFADWCDVNNHSDFLLDATKYKHALDAYTQHLIAAMAKDDGIGEFTANRLQAEVVKSGSVFFPATSVNFRSDLPIIYVNASSNEPTETPSQQEMAAHLTPCQYLFDGITDFLLKGHNFPHRIPYMETEALLLPAEYAITTAAIVENTLKVKNSIIWDYRFGNVSSLSECKTKTNQRISQLIPQRDEALELLRKSNDDLRHPKRLWLAQLAQDAFVSLFVANAGLNESQLRKLAWSGSYEISNSESAGFVVIKCRAGDMEQQFEIKKTFHKQFKKFLRLREYLCGECSSDYLFVNFTKQRTSSKPIRANTIHNFNCQIRSFIDPGHQGLTFQKLRKYKSVYLLSKNYTVGVVSAIMQNSGQTVLNHYAQAEEKLAIDEISTTLNFVVSILERESKIETPSGGCSGGNPSEADTPSDQYEPNCRNFVGCIFCNEFRLHADEASVRKMLSMRYVTAERLSSCDDLDQFQALHGKAIERIDFIMADLVQIRPEMQSVVNKVKYEIEHQFKLSTYWGSLYGRLLKLKVIK
ncbi:hypothetical protein PS673_02019 [Pseudomonas fluorescens]|jgi:hypothetical protein|uniref:Integrase n=1 Tax=Pseudomonas fluorescens TaxID=294 RepID=A0A5E6S498_PSEFL|nr:integrase [Pseudomonas fluorescens]VVM75884.1 hypothetical protein PS673_02019 [Pseudomonas fluorescens]